MKQSYQNYEKEAENNTKIHIIRETNTNRKKWNDLTKKWRK